MDITNINRVPAFTTKDGSEIRELLAHRNSCIRHQSLAEARLPVMRSVVQPEAANMSTAAATRPRLSAELHPPPGAMVAKNAAPTW